MAFFYILGAIFNKEIMKKNTWKLRWKANKKKIMNHILLRRDIYILVGVIMASLTCFATVVMYYNNTIVNQNKEFYKNEKIIKYEDLVKDLKEKNIAKYSKNIIYPSYLSFNDIWYDATTIDRILTYKFYYKDGKTSIYQIDSLKTGSLDIKENKEVGTSLFNLAVQKGVHYEMFPFTLQSLLSTVFTLGSLVFILILAQYLIGEVLSGKNFSKKVMDVDVGFDDIIGYNEVKDQFKEIANYLKHKNHYRDNDLVVPKGILLTGDPGVGKTMFAKAFASEVKASLFFASGADFAEMYVGVGPKRVRSLFRSARISAPAIIFIDEFDAIGNRNTMGNDSERLSVINQLLTEMDGMNKKADIFVIATTNYQDKIDSALLRPGRIDKIIHIPTPDKETRKGILEKYLGEYTVNEDLKELIAVRTQSYSGATIKNLVDEVKSLVVKRKGVNNKEITLSEFAEVQENSLLGFKQKIEFKHEQEKRIAYHELGHALLSTVLIPSQTVEKIAIEPRGRALGFTMMTPIEETHLYTKQELLNHVCVLLAGRAAEEIFIGDVTNGAADDLQKANKIVDDLLLKFGMSDDYPLFVDINSNNPVKNNDSKEERVKLLKEQYDQTKDIILLFKHDLDKLALELIEEKKIDGVKLKEIVEKSKLQRLLKAH